MVILCANNTLLDYKNFTHGEMFFGTRIYVCAQNHTFCLLTKHLVLLFK